MEKHQNHVFSPQSQKFLDHVFHNALVEFEGLVPVLETIRMERRMLQGHVISTAEQRALVARVLGEVRSILQELDYDVESFETR